MIIEEIEIIEPNKIKKIIYGIPGNQDDWEFKARNDLAKRCIELLCSGNEKIFKTKNGWGIKYILPIKTKYGTNILILPSPNTTNIPMSYQSDIWGGEIILLFNTEPTIKEKSTIGWCTTIPRSELKLIEGIETRTLQEKHTREIIIDNELINNSYEICTNKFHNMKYNKKTFFRRNND